ncbi:MAG: inositol monophosphatase [Proteobacteria bacterium]|nr:inositol monophosphatase [Pseudomonadota bacterium]
MVSAADPERIGDILRECAQRFIMPRFRMLQQHEIDTKTGPNDLVTVADRESEKFLEQFLEKNFYGSVAIGEEAVSTNSKTTEILRDKDAMAWVIDPVDGTNNFVHGKNEFCVMLACVAGGETVGGWIYDILQDRMLIAEKGSGVAINGAQISVSAYKPLQETEGFAGYSYFPQSMRPHLKELGKSVRSLETLNCAGHEYLNLASGIRDFAIYSRIRPWDHLAGTLAVKEAGGHVMKWDGTPYAPGDEFGGLVIASGAALMRELQQRTINKMVADYKKTM